MKQTQPNIQTFTSKSPGQDQFNRPADNTTLAISRNLEWAVDEISRRWPIEVRGSWASREYHLIRHEGNWNSLSDFDLVSRDILNDETRSAISQFLTSHTAGLRSELPISFRTASELGEVYGRERANTPTRQSQSEAKRLVLFWLAIGIAETCHSTAKYSTFGGCDVRAYFLNKLYLNIWRMVHHVRGTHLRSYADVLAAVPGLSTASLHTSLLLKRGVSYDPNTTATLQELSSSLENVLLVIAPSTDYTETLRMLGTNDPRSETMISKAIDTLKTAQNYVATAIDESLISHSAKKLGVSR